jgi:3-hydroxyacyl-[acyl-carrier-protein] dehydratase
MLAGTFFHIVNQPEPHDEHLIRVQLNPDHEIYKGHFPGKPVTPGVVQIQIITELVEFMTKKKMKLEKMSNCKFLKILNPFEYPFLNFKLHMEPYQEGIKVTASGEEDGFVFFKLSAFYK